MSDRSVLLNQAPQYKPKVCPNTFCHGVSATPPPQRLAVCSLRVIPRQSPLMDVTLVRLLLASGLASAKSPTGFLLYTISFQNSEISIFCYLCIKFPPANPTTGHTARENHNSKRDMHHNFHCSTIYNSQDMEATQMSTDR